MITPEQQAKIDQIKTQRGVKSATTTSDWFQKASANAEKQRMDAEVRNAPGILGVAQGIGKDAFGTLIAKPAFRLSQALATGAGAATEGIGGLTGNKGMQKFGKDLQTVASRDANVPTPFGKIRVEGQKEFGEGGIRQVAGDAAKSASYLAPVGRAGAAVSGMAKGEILKAGLSGAAAGGLGGGLAGLGEGLGNQDAGAGEVAIDTALGAGAGALAGGTLGALGAGVSKGASAIANRNNPELKLKYVTPKSTEIPEEEFKKLVNQGRIAPKTATKSAQYILSPSEREVALKYSDVIDKEPIKTAINVRSKIGQIDEEVGSFLEKNNAIFNKGELKNYLDDVLDDINDISIPEERIQKAKKTLVENFVKNVETKNMKGLWETRKEFDSAIDSAFKGSRTLQKDMKVKLRTAVQDFIAERTPEGQYKAYMKDMSKLFDLQDVVDIKAAKGRGNDAIRQWMKDNPNQAKAAVWGGLLVGAGALSAVGLNALGGSGEK